MLDAILFDLDGTLLPMDQNAFLDRYFRELAAKFAEEFDPKAIVDGLWKGSAAMVKNDGTMYNEQRFWQVFSGLLGEKVLEMRPRFDEFYRNEFDRAQAHTWQAPLAKQAVLLARQQAKTVVLATTPLFPLCAIERRLGWAGLSPADFDLITSYENMTFSKPNPRYYRQILAQTGARPENSLMVGNDVDEDARPAAAVGMDVFLVTDCLLGDAQALPEFRNGDFAAMTQYLRRIGAGA